MIIIIIDLYIIISNYKFYVGTLVTVTINYLVFKGLNQKKIPLKTVTNCHQQKNTTIVIYKIDSTNISGLKKELEVCN